MLNRIFGMKFLFGFAIASMAITAHVQGQVRPTFSIDIQSLSNNNTPGPSTGLLDGFIASPIDEGSILTQAIGGIPGPNIPRLGPLPVPGIILGSVPGSLGTVPGAVGITATGGFGAVELDALSYGHDLGIELMFSVDEWAGGDLAAPPMALNVSSEGPVAGLFEAAADIFRYNGPVVRTGLVPAGSGANNTAFIDGDGLLPSGMPGLGLIEPMPNGCGGLCIGDNLDALDINSTIMDVHNRIFFSLDSGFVDPLDGPLVNSGTAIGMGFSGADILTNFPGGLPGVYAAGFQLGLDVFGFDTDDLDALILQDDGDGIYDPAIDRILFSVRRGSAVIGSLDSLFGVPIEEGDVLSVPIPGGTFPSIYISAEALGLGTIRSGTTSPGANHGDELDALDLFLPGDLDGNGLVDILDLNIVLTNWNSNGTADPRSDIDGNGLVDILDLNVVLTAWNTGAPLPPGGAASIPEPTTPSIIIVGMALALFRRSV